MKKSVGYIVLVIALIVVAVFGAYFLIVNVTREKYTDDQVYEFLEYVPDTKIYNVYTKNKVTINDIYKTYIIGMVLEKLEEECSENNYTCVVDGELDSSVSFDSSVLSLFNNIAKKMYNLEFSKKEIERYLGKYGGYCYLYNGKGFFKSECEEVVYETYHLNATYEYEGNDLVIYENVAAISFGSVYDYYLDKIFGTTKLEEFIYQNSNEFTKYKHVYKKNDSGYYWYSTEVFKEE